MYVCLCVYTGIVRNVLIRGYTNVVRTSSSFRPRTHARTHARTDSRSHTRILIPFEDREPTGLKVDIMQEAREADRENRHVLTFSSHCFYNGCYKRG